MGYRPWGCKESDMTEATPHVHRYATRYGALLMDILTIYSFGCNGHFYANFMVTMFSFFLE